MTKSIPNSFGQSGDESKPSDSEAAAAASEAPAPTPLADDELDRLSLFLNDFLHPIAADGKLAGYEETPLIVAFHVYGIDKLLENHESQVERQIRACIASAQATPAPNATAMQLQDAWQRVLGRGSRLTENEYIGLRTWFNEEAKRLDLEAKLDDPPAAPFRKDPLPNACIGRFSRFFDDARASLAAAEAEEPAATSEAEIEPAILAHEIIGRCSPAVMNSFLSGEFQQELRDRAADIALKMQARLDACEPAGFAFDDWRSQAGEQAVIVRELPSETFLWFVGDIHGDLLGLECVVDYITANSEIEPTIVFLGDLFDDGHYSYEVLLRVFDLLSSQPGNHCVLAGNHDEGLAIDGDGFRSSVWPSNFTDWLNARRDDATVHAVGQLAVRLFEQAPRALYFPDGLLAVHGGVPHCDLHEGLNEAADLGGPQCLQDYVWTRLHPRARRRIPNRSTRGCEIGREDFERFCERATAAIGQPVERVIRGHDHIDGQQRFSRFEKYERNPVLTINTMCHRLAREVFGPYAHTPCIARWRWGEIPEVHCVAIPEDAIDRIYPPESSGEQVDAGNADPSAQEGDE